MEKPEINKPYRLLSAVYLNHLPDGEIIFQDNELKVIWNRGLVVNVNEFTSLYKTLWDEMRCFP